MCIMGVLGNQKREFRCENRIPGEQELFFLAYRNIVVKAQFEDESTHGRQNGLVGRSN